MPRPIRQFAMCVWLLVGTAGGGVLAQSPSASPEPGAPEKAGKAASPEPVVPEKAGKELHAFRIRGAAPRIDGRLDDEVWNQAQALEDLVQEEPDNMEPPTERTIVQIAYDDRYLYFAAHCYANDPSK